MVCVQEGSQSVKGGLPDRKVICMGGWNVWGQVDIHTLDSSHQEKKRKYKREKKRYRQIKGDDVMMIWKRDERRSTRRCKR